MSKKFYIDIDLKQNELENATIHQLSSFPANARRSQIIFHTTLLTFCICWDDSGDTTLASAWKCLSSPTDPIGISGLTCPSGAVVRDVVYISGNSTVTPAKSDAFSTSNVFGFIKSKESSTSCTVLTGGILTGFSGLTSGTQYFLSKNFAGGITDVVPTGTGSVIVRIGKALDTTDLYINIDNSLTIRI